MLADRPLIIAYDGKGVTHLFADGKVYGDGITDILFEHKRPATPYSGHRGKHNVSIHITSDDVNIVGSNEKDDIFAFKMMVDRIIKANNEESAPTDT